MCGTCNRLNRTQFKNKVRKSAVTKEESNLRCLRLKHRKTGKSSPWHFITLMVELHVFWAFTHVRRSRHKAGTSGQRLDIRFRAELTKSAEATVPKQKTQMLKTERTDWIADALIKAHSNEKYGYQKCLPTRFRNNGRRPCEDRSARPDLPCTWLGMLAVAWCRIEAHCLGSCVAAVAVPCGHTTRVAHLRSGSSYQKRAVKQTRSTSMCIAKGGRNNSEEFNSTATSGLLKATVIASDRRQATTCLEPKGSTKDFDLCM